MKIPSKIKTYCPYCRKHTEHTLKKYGGSPQKPHALSRGERKKQRKLKGYGANKIKAHKATPVYKQGKMVALLATCSECGKKHYFVIKRRVKKFELAKQQ